MRISDWSSDVCSSDLDVLRYRTASLPVGNIVGGRPYRFVIFDFGNAGGEEALHRVLPKDSGNVHFAPPSRVGSIRRAASMQSNAIASFAHHPPSSTPSSPLTSLFDRKRVE